MTNPPWFSSTLAAATIAAALLLLAAPRLTAQATFPEGPVRDTVVVVCSQCHPLTRILDSSMTAAEWETYLYDMVARGATLYDRDLERVKTYLVESFATDAR
jgi:hypothetical protein